MLAVLIPGECPEGEPHCYLIIKNERMTIMELDQMLTAAANYGFPMLVSCYLLVRMENKIDQLSANIDALTRVIAAAK